MSDCKWADDQARFMVSGQQTVGVPNAAQTELYVDLIAEEAAEVDSAASILCGMAFPNDEGWADYTDADRDDVVLAAAELADGAVDTIVVCLGLLHSMGIDPQAAWDEVMRSNLAKIDPVTGKVLKRADGKVLKPQKWAPPDMVRVVRDSWGLE